jgi:sialidase-1
MFGRSSGQGPRLFARSDNGGATWAANWSATDLPDPYCEASIVASEDRSSLYFGNPSNAAHRGNFSVHRSTNGGVTWPASEILYHGPAAYSDMSLTRDAKLGFLFERDNYRYVSFGAVPLGSIHDVVPSR